MDLTPIPILCAGCNARIELRADQLDQKLQCAACGQPINIGDYDVLVEAKRRLVESRKAAHLAEKERERQQAEERKELERQERERRDEAKRIRSLQEKQLAEQRVGTEKSKGSSIPDFAEIQTLAILIRILGFVSCGLGFVLAMLLLDGRIGTPKDTTQLIAMIFACIIGGVFYVAIAEIMIAFRDIARNVAKMANRQDDKR